MKILCFTLSIPKNNSWDNKWTAFDRFYARTRKINENDEKKLKTLGIDFNKKENYYFTYDFQDGWIAEIKVKTVSNKEAEIINRKSKGFCMYDWMIDNILNNGKI